MKQRHWYFLYLQLLGFLLTSCVSVSLKQQPSIKSEKISFPELNSPFVKIKNKNFDHYWMSDKTANTIAIYSDCTPDRDISLEAMDRESVDAVDNAEVLSTKKFSFAQREAIATIYTGFIDGIKVKVKNISLKKNGCHFTITYSGVSKKFPSEEGFFDRFLSGVVIQ